MMHQDSDLWKKYPQNLNLKLIKKLLINQKRKKKSQICINLKRVKHPKKLYLNHLTYLHSNQVNKQPSGISEKFHLTSRLHWMMLWKWKTLKTSPSPTPPSSSHGWRSKKKHWTPPWSGTRRNWNCSRWPCVTPRRRNHLTPWRRRLTSKSGPSSWTWTCSGSRSKKPPLPLSPTSLQRMPTGSTCAPV